jgi:enterochelin esterase-like enzyme
LTIINFCFGQESKLEHFTFYSKSLGELREITVYYPQNFTEEYSYNVIFCTDGQFIDEKYKYKLDSVFETKAVTPFVVVGVNSNEKQIPNSVFEYRNFEYIENNPSDNSDLNTRFKRHLTFFVSEVDEYVKNELKLKVDNKYFYGVSNGAGFGVSMSKYYPDLFSKYILYSMAGENYKNLKWNTNQYPFFIIRCGDKEPEPFIEGSKNLSKYLTKKHSKHLFEIFSGGHKREEWLNLFIEDVQRL